MSLVLICSAPFLFCSPCFTNTQCVVDLCSSSSSDNIEDLSFSSSPVANVHDRFMVKENDACLHGLSSQPLDIASSLLDTSTSSHCDAWQHHAVSEHLLVGAESAVPLSPRAAMHEQHCSGRDCLLLTSAFTGW